MPSLQETAGTGIAHGGQKRLEPHLCFAALLSLALVLNERAISSIVSLSLHDQSSSHILLIPIISAFLIVAERQEIFAESRWALAAAVPFATFVGFAAFLSRTEGLAAGSWSLSVASLCVTVAIISAFALCYGSRAFTAALFSLLLLLLMVPLPDVILSRVIYALQQGSTSIAYWLFRIAGVPVLREGFVLGLPNLRIEVAQECSSIRSSIALLVTCLIAGHLYLRRSLSAFFFIVIALPFSVIKNGIRIATLSLLSIYVNPLFIRGSLHRDGGFVFFFLALAMLWPVLRILQKAEGGPQPLGHR
jgi:exosortase